MPLRPFTGLILSNFGSTDLEGQEEAGLEDVWEGLPTTKTMPRIGSGELQIAGRSTIILKMEAKVGARVAASKAASV